MLGMTTPVPARWLTRKEAAAYMTCSVPTIDRWIREGRLTKHTVQDTQSVRLDRDELDSLLKGRDR